MLMQVFTNAASAAGEKPRSVLIATHKGTVRMDDVPALVSLSRQAMLKLVREGKFPVPFQFEHGGWRFRLGDIAEWIDQHRAPRRTDPSSPSRNRGEIESN